MMRSHRAFGTAPAVAPHTRWMALLSLVLLLLVPQVHMLVDHGAVVATPADAHLHGMRHVQAAPLPHLAHASVSVLTDSADLCMLCSVFGSTTQPQLLRMVAPTIRTASFVAVADPGLAPRPPTFDLLSRPPPAATLASSQVWHGPVGLL